MNIRQHHFFITLLATLCTLLASCSLQPLHIIVPDNHKVSVKTLQPQPTAKILTCLAQADTLSPAELDEALTEAQQAFIADSSDDTRLKLICLTLAHQDSSRSLEYVQELMTDMQHIDSTPYPDMKGLAVLLNHFHQLHEKRLHDVHQAEQQVEILRTQLEKMKSIEKIISDRKKDN